MDASAATAPPPSLLATLENLTRFHREHEEFYSQAPLQTAREVQSYSRALKALAARWGEASPSEQPVASPFAGAVDLNAPGLVSESGILFMEGEGEPVEVERMKRDLGTLAGDMEQTGAWLANAMGASWQVAGTLVQFAALADLLGERHRIIANDWQSAGLQQLVGRLLRRALELLDAVGFTPQALREDLRGRRAGSSYLYSSSELLDRAADLLCESATLVHENERRWRIFSQRVRELRAQGEPSA